jgi:hypothetical protein
MATLLALGAIALWSTLAWLGLALAHLPPFLLVGIALAIGAAHGAVLSFGASIGSVRGGAGRGAGAVGCT